MLHTSFSCGVIAASWINVQNHWKMYVKETKINRIKINKNVKNSVDTVKFFDTIFIYCIVLYRIRSDWLLLQTQPLNVFLKSRCSKKISFARGGQIGMWSKITGNKFICMVFVSVICICKFIFFHTAFRNAYFSIIKIIKSFQSI